jgi:hypothetical protein
MSSQRFTTKSVAIALAAAALTPALAAARPPVDPVGVTAQEQQVLAARGQGAPVTRAAPQVGSSDSSGLDLGSAAIGAGAIGGLSLLVAIGSFGLTENRHVRVAR